MYSSSLDNAILRMKLTAGFQVLNERAATGVLLYCFKYRPIGSTHSRRRIFFCIFYSKIDLFCARVNINFCFCFNVFR